MNNSKFPIYNNLQIIFSNNISLFSYIFLLIFILLSILSFTDDYAEPIVNIGNQCDCVSHDFFIETVLRDTYKGPWSGWKKSSCYSGIEFKIRTKLINQTDCKLQILFRNLYSDRVVVSYKITSYEIKEVEKCNKTIDLPPSEIISGGEWVITNCYLNNYYQYRVWICAKQSMFYSEDGDENKFPCDKRIKE